MAGAARARTPTRGVGSSMMRALVLVALIVAGARSEASAASGLLLTRSVAEATQGSHLASATRSCRDRRAYRIRRPSGDVRVLNRRPAHRVVHRLLNRTVGRRFTVTIVRTERAFETPGQVYGLIDCLVPSHFPVLNRGDAHSVAECESGHDPKAYNPTGCDGAGCLGVFQQHAAYWPERARRYGQGGKSGFDGYANVWVSLSMARDGGWEAWACP